jgi:hypothetical protein
MGILSSAKSVFEKVGAEIEKLFGGSASVEQKVQATITFVAPLVNTVVVLADPAIAPTVAKVISTVQADLALVSTVVQGATPAPGSSAATTATTALNSVKTNLSELLTDSGVKNSANFSKISAAVNLIIAEVEAVLSGLSAKK